MGIVTEMLTMLGANLPLVAVGCAEVLAAAALLGRAAVMRTQMGKTRASLAPVGMNRDIQRVLTLESGEVMLVLRRETERPEAVTAGTVKLAGTDTENIYRLAAELLDDPAAYDRMAKAVNPYGDGQACPRIAQAILSHFLPDVQPPEPFAPAR